MAYADEHETAMGADISKTMRSTIWRRGNVLKPSRCIQSKTVEYRPYRQEYELEI